MHYFSVGVVFFCVCVYSTSSILVRVLITYGEIMVGKLFKTHRYAADMRINDFDIAYVDPTPKYILFAHSNQ